MSTKIKIGNILLIPIIVAILASTAWSVYKSSQSHTKKAPPVKEEMTTDNFFEKLYRERLIEEGNRQDEVEKLIKQGTLSDKPARYTKPAKETKP